MIGWGRGRLAGGALRVRRSAQAHQPGGVTAKVSGRRGTTPYRALPLPEKIHALIDAWIETVMDRAPESSGFEKFPLGMICTEGYGHFGLQSHDPPRRIGTHLLHRLHRHPLQLEPVPLGHDPHDRGHTGGQSRGHEIGGRKTFPLPFVVERGIRGELGAGRAVDRLAVKLTLVADGDSYRQGRISCGCRRKSGPTRPRFPGGT